MVHVLFAPQSGMSERIKKHGNAQGRNKIDPAFDGLWGGYYEIPSGISCQ